MPTAETTIPRTCRRIQSLADRNPRRAVALARHAQIALHPADPIAAAWVSYTLGWSLLRWERVDVARDYLHAASEEFARLSHQYGALRCRYALLLSDQMQLSRANLDQEFALLADQFVAVGALADAAEVTLDQARQINMLGRPQEAVAVLDRTAPILAARTPFDSARMLRVRGVAANARGDFSGAQQLLVEAEYAFRALNQPIEVAKCWLELAWLALRQELLDTALEGYQRAERVFIRFDLPLQRAFCAKNYSLLLAKRGDYDLALHSSITALRDFTALQRVSDIGACHLHLGNIYFYIGHWDAALACYKRAEMIYEQLGLTGYSLFACRNRAMIYHAQMRFGEARDLLVILEEQARTLDNQTEVAEIYAVQAALLADTGDVTSALARYRDALAMFMQLGNQHAVGECKLALAWLALKQGAIELARSLLESAQPALQSHPHDHWRLLYGLGRSAELQGDVTLALDYYQAAITIVAGLRRRLANEGISSSLYTQAIDLHADSLRLAVERVEHNLILQISELQRGLVLQRLLATHLPPVPETYAAEYERMHSSMMYCLEQDAHIADLDAALADYNDLLLHARHSSHQPEPEIMHAPMLIDLASIRARLMDAHGQDWSVLIYVLEGDTLLIGELTVGSLIFETTPFDPALRTLIARASQHAYRDYTYRDFPYIQGKVDRPWAQLRVLTDRLLPAPLIQRLHPNHRLLIIPAGPLHALPWAALRLEHAWLVEQAIIQIVPSLTTWLLLAARPQAPPTSALFVGCAAFGERASALPGIADEQAALQRVYPFQQTLIDTTAERVALLTQSQRGELASYGVIHIASHAQLMPTRGLAAHVKLWDTDLLLPEIAELRLGGGLVTLSSCDGAAADVLPGEEVLSLSWAFLAAGATCVLSSLWPVYDRAVVQLMTQFYAVLRQHGDVATALAHAQRGLIASRHVNGDLGGEPQHWASFVLIGHGSFRMATGGTAPPPSVATSA